MKAREDGGISPKHEQLVPISENAISVDEMQEDQGQTEDVCIVSIQSGTTLALTVTSSSHPMSMGKINDEFVLTIATIHVVKLYFQAAIAT